MNTTALHSHGTVLLGFRLEKTHFCEAALFSRPDIEPRIPLKVVADIRIASEPALVSLIPNSAPIAQPGE